MVLEADAYIQYVHLRWASGPDQGPRKEYKTIVDLFCKHACITTVIEGRDRCPLPYIVAFLYHQLLDSASRKI